MLQNGHHQPLLVGLLHQVRHDLQFIRFEVGEIESYDRRILSSDSLDVRQLVLCITVHLSGLKQEQVVLSWVYVLESEVYTLAGLW